MTYVVGLVALLVVLAGIIAYAGDRLGTWAGRKRLSVFGARPRATGQIVGVVVGILIMLTTLAVLAAAFQNATQTLVNAQRTSDELGRLRSAERVLQIQLDELQTELGLAEATIASAQEEREAAVSERDAARASRDEVQGERDELQAEIDEIRTSLDSLSTELAVADAGLRAVQDELSQAEGERDVARRETEVARSEAEAARAEVDAARREAEVAIEEADAARAEAVSARAEADRLQEEVAEVQVTLDDTTLLLIDSQVQLREASESVAEAEARLQEAEVARADADAARDAAFADRDAAALARDEVQAEADELRTQGDALRDEADALQLELDALRDEVAVLTDEAARLRVEADGLQRANTALASRNDELVLINEDFVERNEELQGLNDSFRQQIIDSNLLLREVGEQVEQLQGQIEEQARRLSEVQLEFSRASSGEMTFASNQVIYSGAIYANEGASVREELADFVRRASAATASRGAGEVVLSSEQFNSLVEVISETEGSDLVRLISPRNQFSPTQVEVVVEALENTRIFDRGRLLVSRQIHLGSPELPSTQAELNTAIAQIKGEAVRVVRRAGLDELQAPVYEGVSDESFMNQLLRLSGPVVIGVSTIEAVDRAGPARVELVIIY